MKVLVLGEYGINGITDATLATITAASLIGKVDLLLVGEDIESVLGAACSIEDVGIVYAVTGEISKHQFPESVAPLVVRLMADYYAFMAPATSTGKGLAPRVAALLDVMQISEITGVEGERVFKRTIYAGNAIATIRSRDPKLVLTVRPSAFAKATEGRGMASVSRISDHSEAGGIQFVGADTRTSSRPSLTSAKIVVSGGRALQSAERFQTVIAPLADKLGAAIGASRAAVDAGWLPYNFQVGQTGMAVAPDIYFAIGISGAIQHLAGMRESKVIVAINKDRDAPIFEIADIGLVADIFDAVPELTSKL